MTLSNDMRCRLWPFCSCLWNESWNELIPRAAHQGRCCAYAPSHSWRVLTSLRREGEAAESCYLEAIDRLRGSRVRHELVRADLLYGEWLRREGRRVDARTRLHTAHDMFTAIGMVGFAERARRELLATGDVARKRNVETHDELTRQEKQIALMVRDGLSNSEVGGRLFISPRTVEWHLRKVFVELEISSRKELRTVLVGAEYGLDHAN